VRGRKLWNLMPRAVLGLEKRDEKNGFVERSVTFATYNVAGTKLFDQTKVPDFVVINKNNELRYMDFKLNEETNINKINDGARLLSAFDEATGPDY